MSKKITKKMIAFLIVLSIVILLPSSIYATENKESLKVVFKEIYFGTVLKNLNGESLNNLFDFEENCPGNYGCVYKNSEFFIKTIDGDNKYHIDVLAINKYPGSPGNIQGNFKKKKPYAHSNWIYRSKIVYTNNEIENGRYIINDEDRLIDEMLKHYMDHPSNVKQFMYDYLRDRYYDRTFYFEKYQEFVDKQLVDEQPKIVYQVLSTIANCINFKEVNKGSSIADCMRKHKNVDYFRTWDSDIKGQDKFRYHLTVLPVKIKNVRYPNKKLTYPVPKLKSSLKLVSEGLLQVPTTFYYYEPAVLLKDQNGNTIIERYDPDRDYSGYQVVYPYYVRIHYYVRIITKDILAKKGNATTYLYYHIIVDRNLGDIISKKLAKWQQVVDGNIAKVTSECYISKEGGELCSVCKGYLQNNVEFPLTYHIKGVSKIKWRKENVYEGLEEETYYKGKKCVKKSNGKTKCYCKKGEGTEGGRQKVDVKLGKLPWEEEKEEEEDDVVVGPKETKKIIETKMCVPTSSLRPEIEMCITSTKTSCKYDYDFKSDSHTIFPIDEYFYTCGEYYVGKNKITLGNSCPVFTDEDGDKHRGWSRRSIPAEKLRVRGEVQVSAKEFDSIFSGYGVQGGSSSDRSEDTIRGKSARSPNCKKWEEETSTKNDQFPEYDPSKHNERIGIAIPLKIKWEFKNVSLKYLSSDGWNQLNGSWVLWSNAYYLAYFKTKIKKEYSFKKAINTKDIFYDLNDKVYIVDGSPVSCTITITSSNYNINCDPKIIAGVYKNLQLKAWAQSKTPIYIYNTGLLLSKNPESSHQKYSYYGISHIFYPKKNIRESLIYTEIIDDKFIDTILEYGIGWEDEGGKPSVLLKGNPDMFKKYEDTLRWAFSDSNIIIYLEGEHSSDVIPSIKNKKSYYGEIFKAKWLFNNKEIGDFNIKQSTEDIPDWIKNVIIEYTGGGSGDDYKDKSRLWTVLYNDNFFVAIPRIAVTENLWKDNNVVAGATLVDSTLKDPREGFKGVFFPVWVTSLLNLPFVIHYKKGDPFIYRNYKDYTNERKVKVDVVIEKKGLISNEEIGRYTIDMNIQQKGSFNVDLKPVDALRSSDIFFYAAHRDLGGDYGLAEIIPTNNLYESWLYMINIKDSQHRSLFYFGSYDPKSDSFLRFGLADEGWLGIEDRGVDSSLFWNFVKESYLKCSGFYSVINKVSIPGFVKEAEGHYEEYTIDPSKRILFAFHEETPYCKLDTKIDEGDAVYTIDFNDDWMDEKGEIFEINGYLMRPAFVYFPASTLTLPIGSDMLVRLSDGGNIVDISSVLDLSPKEILNIPSYQWRFVKSITDNFYPSDEEEEIEDGPNKYRYYKLKRDPFTKILDFDGLFTQKMVLISGRTHTKEYSTDLIPLMDKPLKYYLDNKDRYTVLVGVKDKDGKVYYVSETIKFDSEEKPFVRLFAYNQKIAIALSFLGSDYYKIKEDLTAKGADPNYLNSLINEMTGYLKTLEGKYPSTDRYVLIPSNDRLVNLNYFIPKMNLVDFDFVSSLYNLREWWEFTVHNSEDLEDEYNIDDDYGYEVQQYVINTIKNFEQKDWRNLEIRTGPWIGEAFDRPLFGGDPRYSRIAGGIVKISASSPDEFENEFFKRLYLRSKIYSLDKYKRDLENSIVYKNGKIVG